MTLRHIQSQNYVILQGYNAPHITNGLTEKKAATNSSIGAYFPLSRMRMKRKTVFWDIVK